MTPELPKDLSGLQKLADHVIVQEGDLWVLHGRPDSFVTSEYLGDKVEDAESRWKQYGWGIYRRLSLPTHDHADEAVRAVQDAYATPPFSAITQATVTPPDTQFANSEGWSDTAKRLVLGDRNADYGDPKDDFSATGLIWTGLLQGKLRDGQAITATDVALMMTALKLRRETHRPKDDNIVDAHGYLLCHEWIKKGRKP